MIDGVFDPDRPTVVFIPGGPGGFKSPETLSHNNDSNFNIVHVHHRGVGCTKVLSQEHSQKFPYEKLLFSRERAADDLEAVRKDLIGTGGKWFIYGVSYGGMVAMAYGAKYPDAVDGLILDSTFHRSDYTTLGRNVFFRDLFKITRSSSRLLLKQ